MDKSPWRIQSLASFPNHTAPLRDEMTRQIRGFHRRCGGVVGGKGPGARAAPLLLDYVLTPSFPAQAGPLTTRGTVTILAVPKSPGFGTPVEDEPNGQRRETSPREGTHREEPVPRENVRTDANSRRTRTTRRDGESRDNAIQGGCAADQGERTRKRTLQYATYHAETAISPFRHIFVGRNQGERLRVDGQHEPRNRGPCPAVRALLFGLCYRRPLTRSPGSHRGCGHHAGPCGPAPYLFLGHAGSVAL